MSKSIKLSTNIVLYQSHLGVPVTIGEAKRRLVAAIYAVAKLRRYFIAADVWAYLADPELRAKCADSRLIAAAFSIARRTSTRIAYPANPSRYYDGDRLCQGRPQRVWESRVFGGYRA